MVWPLAGQEAHRAVTTMIFMRLSGIREHFPARRLEWISAGANGMDDWRHGAPSSGFVS